MHSSSNIYHHIAAATNIMLLTVRHDIVERDGTLSTSHIMMCCVMNMAAVGPVDFLNSKTAYYCPYQAMAAPGQVEGTEWLHQPGGVPKVYSVGAGTEVPAKMSEI